MKSKQEATLLSEGFFILWLKHVGLKNVDAATREYIRDAFYWGKVIVVDRTGIEKYGGLPSVRIL